MGREGLVLVGATALALCAPPSADGAAGDLRIHDIQGPVRLSPYDGQRVSGVRGIVTAVRGFGSSRGFWVQDPVPDSDAATSEGLLVSTGSVSPRVAVGDRVEVAGTVAEHYPDGSADTAVHQSTTELVGATWTVESSGHALPAAEVLDVPRDLTARGDIESLPLRPHRFALDRCESLEGMRVRVDDAQVVGPTTEHDELWVTTRPGENRTARGGVLYSSHRADNTGRVKVGSLLPPARHPFPRANVRDTLTGETSGPLDYDESGGYTIRATVLGDLEPGGLRPETTRRQREDELAIATLDVAGLAATDPAATFQRLAHDVVENLASPDVLALREVQDDNGAVDDQVVTAGATLRKLTDAVVAAGGPRYEWRQLDPADDADGGAPGGNPRVAFLFDPSRVSFVDRPGGDATTPAEVVDGHLSVSPGRVAPASPVWTGSRKSLAGEFTFRGRAVFVVANHFTSKAGDEPLYGRHQPPARPSEPRRIAQAREVRRFVQRLPHGANAVVLGDLNDFRFSRALDELTPPLLDLAGLLPRDERYGHVHDGNAQALDHVLVGGRTERLEYDVVHVNAEFGHPDE